VFAERLAKGHLPTRPHSGSFSFCSDPRPRWALTWTPAIPPGGLRAFSLAAPEPPSALP
jgi:hypothetical protein